jgi:hypothetical protein
MQLSPKICAPFAIPCRLPKAIVGRSSGNNQVVDPEHKSCQTLQSRFLVCSIAWLLGEHFAERSAPLKAILCFNILQNWKHGNTIGATRGTSTLLHVETSQASLPKEAQSAECSFETLLLNDVSR